MVLLGCALGWALLAVLSVRFSDQPQRWAAAPAMFMAVVGVAALSGSAAVQDALGWTWPPALFVLAVWMLSRVRRQQHGAHGGCCTRFLPCWGSPRWVAATRRSGSLSTPGPTRRPASWSSIGGHRLHLNCTGTGSPTVVLEPGQGGSSSSISPGSRRRSHGTPPSACTTAPAEAGATPPTNHKTAPRSPPTCTRCSTGRRFPGPYVLAGHSFGGLYVQAFAAQYPNEVAGLVLLDSTAPKPGPTLPTSTSDTIFGRVTALVPAIAHLGAGRLIAQASYADLPSGVQGEARANASLARNLGSYIDEFVDANTAMQQAAALTNLHGKPLIVLTADTGNDAGWQEKQDHMAALSTNSRHRVAHATTHDSMVERPRRLRRSQPSHPRRRRGGTPPPDRSANPPPHLAQDSVEDSSESIRWRSLKETTEGQDSSSTGSDPVPPRVKDLPVMVWPTRCRCDGWCVPQRIKAK